MSVTAPDTARVAETFAATRAAYEATRAAYRAAGYDARYPLGAYWIDNLKTLIPLLAEDTDPLAKLRRVHETVMYTIASPVPETKARMVEWYLAYLEGRGVRFEDLPPRLEESAYSNPANTVIRCDRRLSPDFLRTLVLTLEIERHCAVPPGRFPVLELGAGYGGLARTFKLRHPGATYVIVDIPETLFFSSTFLRLNFPEARVLAVTEPDHLAGSIDEFDFVFVPTMFAPGLDGRTVTLFCNTASLGEMRNEVIRHWMDVVQNRIAVRYFFGLNRLLNTVPAVANSPRLDENCASVSFDAGWRILYWELDPPFARCPYLETLVSRNLEVIAERRPRGAADVEADGRRSAELAQAVAGEDWCSRPTVREQRIHPDDGGSWPPLGTRVSPALAPDLTMSGPLFALWESIRLHPTPTNVGMMLRLLDTLGGGLPFEETFYYRDLLARLTGVPVVEPRWQSAPARRGRAPADLVRRLTPQTLRQALKRTLRRLYYGEVSP